MSKLTNAEKDKLDNTCGNLRVTKLGTHVKSLEDFVNEGILKTRADDVSSAINELWDMITNKDCESITIPPPGFFTLFGDDQTGKLYVYYNNADYPPQFHHVETPGELEGTLYLYIADPIGENHYELEVGHYIAVRHLDNYYTKAQINSMFTITVEKQSTAESGSFATYVVKQGGNQVGSKINIPKDYLVKSCSVKTCTTANVPVQGYKVGDKYIDWVINTRDSSATNEHLYLLVSEIAEPYKADNSTITLSSGNVFSVKDGGITLVKLAPAVQNLINGKAESDHAHGKITKEGKVGTAANVPLITGTGGVVQAGSFGSGTNNFARGNHGHSDLASIAYVDQQIVNIEGDIEVDFDSKADVDHSHGYINKDGVISNQKSKNVVTDSNGKITTEDKLVVDSALSSNSTNPVQNKKVKEALDSINGSISTKVDKVNGKSLSSNDFTDILKAKLDAIDEEANKYTHPSTHPSTMIVEASALSNIGSAANANQHAVNDKINNVLGGINNALGSINNALAGKVDKISGKSLSANDFTDELKSKLDSIYSGARAKKRILGYLITSDIDTTNEPLIRIQKDTRLKVRLYDSENGNIVEGTEGISFPPQLSLNYCINNVNRTLTTTAEGSTFNVGLPAGEYPVHFAFPGSGNYYPVYRSIILQVV